MRLVDPEIKSVAPAMRETDMPIILSILRDRPIHRNQLPSITRVGNSHEVANKWMVWLIHNPPEGVESKKCPLFLGRYFILALRVCMERAIALYL